jgi:hypothetical protein
MTDAATRSGPVTWPHRPGYEDIIHACGRYP